MSAHLQKHFLPSLESSRYQQVMIGWWDCKWCEQYCVLNRIHSDHERDYYLACSNITISPTYLCCIPQNTNSKLKENKTRKMWLSNEPPQKWITIQQDKPAQCSLCIIWRNWNFFCITVKTLAELTVPVGEVGYGQKRKRGSAVWCVAFK